MERDPACHCPMASRTVLISVFVVSVSAPRVLFADGNYVKNGSFEITGTQRPTSIRDAGQLERDVDGLSSKNVIRGAGVYRGAFIGVDPTNRC